MSMTLRVSTHPVKVVEVQAQVLATHLEVHGYEGLRGRGWDIMPSEQGQVEVEILKTKQA
jgi:hypothetical protein